MCEGIILAKIQTIYKYSQLTLVVSNSLPDSPVAVEFRQTFAISPRKVSRDVANCLNHFNPLLPRQFGEGFLTVICGVQNGNLYMKKGKCMAIISGKVWRYIEPMNPTKWSKILKSNSIHFEFRGTPSWKTRHESWVINTKHWPVLQRTQSLHLNITMGVLVCPNSTVCGC